MGGSQSLGGRHRNLTTGRKSREPPQSPPDVGPSRRHAPRGLSSVSRLRRRRRRQADAGDGLSGGSAENNRLWLLADSPVVVDESAEVDLHSVHSSFRFSFGSQEEARARIGTGDGEIAGHPGATVLLLVDLEDDGEEDSKVEAARNQQWQPIESLERSISPAAGSLARFSYREIRSATRNFSRERELGRGALSRVYKGRIGARWRAVAIKRLEGHGRESAKAFCRELLIASSLSHPNVAPLIGFSAGPEGLFLVYKFISGGSLDGHLHHHHGKRGKVLPWDVRYKVAVGVARAVEYLHYGTDKCVIHRDIKSSNILLSSKKNPKLCDFGLATWTYGPSQPFLCKAVKGTFGYLAPEYFQHGKLSDRTDVYAFGVVLLELITGRKAIDQSRPQGDENLVLWAKPLLLQGEGAIGKLLDPKLEPGSYPWSEVRRMVGAATACVNSQESVRPSIEQVVGMLQGEEEMCADLSVFTGNSCLTGYGCQSSGKSDMKSHLALAMLGVSDAEEDDIYGR